MTRRSPLRHGVAVVVALVAAVAGAVLPSLPAQAAALTNTVRPSIGATASGTTCVLTANRGTWTPAPTSYGYQWYVAGAAVAGATATSYTVATADVGKVVGVRVTAARAGYTSATAASENTLAYTTTTTWNVSPPVVTGTAAVGRAASVNRGVWCPAVTSYTYQWISSGTAITGATAATYTPTPAQAGAPLSVRVHGRLAGRTTGYRTSAAVVVARGTMTVAAAPVVTGTVAVGATVQASSPRWTPAASRVGYQWAADGVPISGATLPTYTIGASTLGARLTFSAVGELDGYDPSTASSAPTSPVAAGGITTLREPALGGSPVVGKPLEVLFGAYQPADAFQRYAWQRDGAPISGAVGSSYTPVPSDLGHSLSVVVTVARDGYADTIRQLAAGNVRLGPHISVRDIGLDHAARFVLRVTGGGKKATGKVVVKVGKRDKAVRLHHGRATVRLTKLKPGQKKYVVTYRGNPTIGAGTKTGKVTVRR